MTRAQALAIPTSTDEFDAAVDAASDACAADRNDREAAAVLAILLDRNEQAIKGQLFGFRA
jgi:hypothetical protein